MNAGVYVKKSDEAVELYKKAFGLELGYHVKNPDGTYFHSELCKDGKEIFDVIESKQEQTTNNIVQLGMELESEDAVKKAYELLCEGGKVETPIGPLPWTPCAASVVDRFGVWWYISASSHYPPEDYDPEKPWDASMYKKP